MATAAEYRGRKVFQYFVKVRIFHSLVLLPCTLNFSYLKFFITWEETSSYSLVALCPNCIVSKVMFWRSYRIMWNIRTVQSDALYMHYIERVTIFSYLRYIFLNLRLWKWTRNTSGWSYCNLCQKRDIFMFKSPSTISTTV